MKVTLEIGGAMLTGAILLLGTSGCFATRGWVEDRLRPITGQLGQLDSRVHDADTKADRTLVGLQNLHVERRLVLDSRQGPTFAFGSAGLSKHAKGEIDRFFKELAESRGAGSGTAERVFVVAGHTDSVGPEDYNYELGQRRATRVAGYLVGRKGVDPMQVRVVSYGASKPVAQNHSATARRQNRRVEILVYQEKIATGS